MITTIFIDYAGVLTPTKNNFPFVEKYHADYHLNTEELMKLSYTNWDKAAIEEIDSKQYWEDIANLLKTDSYSFKTRVLQTYPIDQRVIEVLKKLKKQYKLVLVSNQIRDWLEEVIAENNLMDIFDYTANSYEVGVRKPDKGIFDYALKISHSIPSETVFIDDDMKNINAANGFGLKTIQFTTFEDFEQALSDVLKTD